jgi:LPPG:FO 2-phospho-L-lactate transferase
MRVVALAGGVGGAKLVDGLARNEDLASLTVLVNTGDDFEHFGLRICPDLDTVVYTLAGIVDPEKGWGRAGESWNFMRAIADFGGADWFQLGDRDLALHVYRTEMLRDGHTLSEVTRNVCRALGVNTGVIPMTDDQVPTIVLTEEGELPFQEYFVARRFEPVVNGFRFEGVEEAKPAPEVLPALASADLVVLCPSNPWVSLDPILAIPGIRSALVSKTVVGVSPIIAGKAVKGPAARMFEQLGFIPGPAAVAQHFRDLLTGLIIDHEDASSGQGIADMGVAVKRSDILMRSVEDRERLGRQVVDFAVEIRQVGVSP